MNTLEKHTLRLIGESIENPDVFLDTATGMAQIRQSVNDGIQELCMVTGSYRKTYLLPLYADRIFYRMGWEADHFGYVIEAWDRSRQVRLIQIDLIALNNYDSFWMKRTGNPDMYMQIGEDILGIFRKPSANGIVLELDCVCIPKAYTEDTDPVKIRETYERATVYLSVSEFYASRGDAARATEYLTKYIETAGLMTLHPQYQERFYRFKGKDEIQQRT